MALTAKDLDRIGKLIDKKLDEKIRFLPTKDEFKDLEDRIKFLPTRKEFKDLEEKVGFLPTKDEFYVRMDKLMKELETIREELTLTPSFTRFADLEERVELNYIAFPFRGDG